MYDYTSINPSILIGEVPLNEQLRRVVEAGFTGVELWWPFHVADPPRTEVDVFLGTFAESGLALVGLNSYEGGMAEGNRGIACWPAVDLEFDATIETAARIASETGCPAVNVLHGVRRPDEPAELQDARAADRTARAADRLSAYGLAVTIEQLSHISGYGLRSASDVLAALERTRAHVTSGTVLIQVDLFHMFQMNDDVAAFFRAHWRDIGHVQVADAPGRGAPGTGVQPIDELLDLLISLGYERGIALEYSDFKGDDPFAGVRRNRRDLQ